MSKRYYIIFLLSITIFCNAQFLPPVEHFKTEDYSADNQNWSITQTANKFIFFANGKGLLKYDGEHWEFLGSPNNTILRSVKAVGNKIFSGAYMEFGVWEENSLGKYKYTSLSKDIQLIEDEQFWTISSLEDFVVFQSLDAIYFYNTSTEKITNLEVDGEITKMVVINQVIYFHVKNIGLFKLINGQQKLINDSDVFKSSTLINIYELNGQIFAQTQFNGIINIDSNEYFEPASSLKNWDSLSVYSSYQKPNGDIFIGTISNGLFKISNNKVAYHLDIKTSLTNNTVLSVFNDVDNNIWLGLDNGINVIDDQSNISIFNDKDGRIGAVYASMVYNDILYVGTNQGLFYYDESIKNFKQVQGTNGQVWSLFQFKNALFCGHHNGTYTIDGNKSTLIDNTKGTWTFRIKDNDILYSGNYDGIYIYKNKNGCELDKKIEGFDISTQFFEFIDNNSILVNHEYKGVLRLAVNEDLSKVKNVEKAKSVDKGLFSSLITYKDKILYGYRDGIFYYDKLKNEFKKDSAISQIVSSSNFTSGKMIKTKDGKLWMFNKTDIVSVSESSINNQYQVDKIPIGSKYRYQISGYENISYIGDEQYILGTSLGLFKFDSNVNIERESEVFLTGISILNRENKELKNFELSNIDFDYNNLTINISAFNHDPFQKSEYQYKLDGYNEKWSEWKDDSRFEFNNLKYGDYVLNFRSRVGENNVSNIKKFAFTISKPYYLSSQMLLLYLFVLILIGVSIHLIYKSYYKKQKLVIQEEAERKLQLKDLEAQKEIMHLNNQKLKEDIENKNRELAISTMSLIKKNEFLSHIKTDLKPLNKSNKRINQVIKSIDSNINSKDDWQFFEEAFNNADKDFFKKLKQNHPSLTHNDFKLCAYLRLNLTSKEIAPLFNISPKSVEIKRYRLRKKMNLERDQSLTDYILGI